ncbi:endonuclease [Treponema primitia]|uniref:endonuclease n=1 Tax=Treponema primitia TaxID=88058 RepID=UPI0018E0F206|nr:endonuclease [Treponema primitia]
MLRFRIFFILFVFLFLGVRLSAESIKLCSFNIQIFGVSKMAKPEVVSILTDIVSRSDVTAVQEVRSQDIAPVVQFMHLLPPKYAYVLGPREGRSGSKEQYWIIYDATKLHLIEETTWADPEDIFERNPLGVYFQTKDKFDFILIDNHIQPSNAAREISAMPEVVKYFQELWNERDVVIAGDFNADGVYYDEHLLATVFPEHEYQIIITNDYDTTLAASDNTYDRIIITTSAIEDYTGACGVIRFDELYDFSVLTIQPRHVSDHYPVWAEFNINVDTD